MNARAARPLLHCLLLLCAACAPHQGPEVDGQSHWLTRCDASAACGAQGTCACGVCTRACSAPNDCGSSRTSVCAPAAGLPDECGAPPGGEQAICLALCNGDDGDCPGGLRCAEGLCVASTNEGDAGALDAGAPTADAGQPLALGCEVAGLSADCPIAQPAFTDDCARVGQRCAYPDGPNGVAIMSCEAQPSAPPGWGVALYSCAPMCSNSGPSTPIPGPPCAERPLMACPTGSLLAYQAVKAALGDVMDACNAIVENEGHLAVNLEQGCPTELFQGPEQPADTLSCLLDGFGQLRLECAAPVDCASWDPSTLQ